MVKEVERSAHDIDLMWGMFGVQHISISPTVYQKAKDGCSKVTISDCVLGLRLVTHQEVPSATELSRTLHCIVFCSSECVRNLNEQTHNLSSFSS